MPATSSTITPPASLRSERARLQLGIVSGFISESLSNFIGIRTLHPFREGNGRAQREFIRELAMEAGYEIAWDLVTQDEMFAASVASFHGGSSEAFATILNKIIRPVR